MIDRLKKWEFPDMEQNDTEFVHKFTKVIESINTILNSMAKISSVSNTYLLIGGYIDGRHEIGTEDEVSNIYTKIDDKFSELETSIISLLYQKVVPLFLDENSMGDAESQLEIAEFIFNYFHESIKSFGNEKEADIEDIIDDIISPLDDDHQNTLGYSTMYKRYLNINEKSLDERIEYLEKEHKNLLAEFESLVAEKERLEKEKTDE